MYSQHEDDATTIIWSILSWLGCTGTSGSISHLSAFKLLSLYFVAACVTEVFKIASR